MNQSEIKKLKQILQQIRTDLQELEKISQQAGKTVELDQARTGRLTRMDAMQAQEMAQETGRRRQQKLLMIEVALQKIKADEYGYCTGCDEEIAFARLHIDPSNTLCIHCAEKL